MSFSEEKIRSRALICWLIALIFGLLQFDLQIVMSFFTRSLAHEFHLTSMGVANLSSAFFYAYLIMHIPVGLLYDRFSVRNVFSISATITAIGCFIFATSTTIQLAYLGRIMMGGGAAFAYVGLLVVVNQMFPNKHFAIMLGISEFAALVGAGFLENGFAVLITQHGWRATMLISGVGLLLLALLAYIFFLSKKPQTSIDESEILESPFKKISQILTNPPVILSCLYALGIFSIASGFASLWAIPLLKSSYSFVAHAADPNLEAAHIAEMILIGIGVGSPFIGWISNRYSLSSIMFISALVAFTVMSALVCISITREITMILFFFIIGVACSAYILCFTIAKKYARPQNQSLAIAITNMFVVMGNILFQPLIGGLLDLHHAMTHEPLSQITIHDYNFALMVLPIAFATSAVIALLLRRYP